jgi:hypothetical protein
MEWLLNSAKSKPTLPGWITVKTWWSQAMPSTIDLKYEFLSQNREAEPKLS